MNVTLSQILVEFGLGEPCSKKIEQIKQNIIKESKKPHMIYQIIDSMEYFQGPMIIAEYRAIKPGVVNLGRRYPEDKI